MIMSHIGEFSALGVAIVWTVTALAFEYAADKVGSLNPKYAIEISIA
jgi:hypothetical protein